ncbi:hypothetical protein MGMO_11c00540 [Methyloglobulus morosus KoM1]|uniref:DUF4145 domain-containing protein n=1 Tax=Methyloglobulus morosus KoM1 TaxID=1116472 RepID=V5C5K8_9GAMM|nr:DUF4145 domain-containing protein [Methyloglobulus morosus]ESS73747.1 hypothetical protein MGMO_11c00540 [Methyloglobulus morosus KoM1]
MKNLKFCTYCDANTVQKMVFETSKWHVHEVAFKKEKTDLSESTYTLKEITEQVCQCLGCERIHIYYTEEIPTSDPKYKPHEYQVPKKLERVQPNWFKDINLDYFDLLGELYSNYNQGNYISFSICSRTLVDTILTESIGDIGGFAEKLTKFKSNGYITNTQYEILKFLVNSGNASAHRAYKPSKDIASNILDIVEHILKEDVLAKKSLKQVNEIPKRNIE